MRAFVKTPLVLSEVEGAAASDMPEARASTALGTHGFFAEYRPC
jgi:hypothetical protein